MQSFVLNKKDWVKTFDHLSRVQETQRISLAIARNGIGPDGRANVAFKGMSYDPNQVTLSLPVDAVVYVIQEPVEISLTYVATDIIDVGIVARDGTRYRVTFLPPLHLPDLLLTFAPIRS